MDNSKPVEVVTRQPQRLEAMHFTRANRREVAEWFGGYWSYDNVLDGYTLREYNGAYVAIEGYWIIKNQYGEYDIVSQSDFWQQYTVVDSTDI